ncbi:ABC transporter ATP-binding protein [Vagococcus lutrae]|uniref:ABC transporter ATP-binding protein n=1 Tax=Vagococcus lutrae TaxID=81947 RepID=UPI00200F5F57|nr:ABC transporter ATP-binding protein [Vagococcus lutrae]MDT2806634.1 ABC transporter ATP-binding protein [Vagococcus lutrae]MDT2824017.1 ABC transporter ATP-binding protein [Vagococcus lutrae]UQF12523.1 ABC transporter ATP-binding protein/permease [Vagococcus lutrae]UQF18774.1 ABC transporter ATP-binding protein/permease [Vagococcus lutrae]WEB80981.1 ABC transporter ATP-binding protein/permease [Vagococcus lutrae]
MLKIIKKMSMTSIIGAIVFMFVQVLSDLKLPSLTSDIINNGVAKGDIDYIWSVGLVMIGFSIISITAAIGNTFFAVRESQKIGRSLRSELYSKVTYSSHEQFDEHGTASLITRTTNDVNQIQLVSQLFLRVMITAPIMLIGASTMAYRKDPQLTKIFFYVLPILVVFIGVILYFAVPLFTSLQKKTDRLNLVFREGLTGVRVIRAFNRAEYEANRFDEANQDYVNTAIKVNTIVAFMIPIVTLIMSGTNVAIIWFGGHYISEGTLEVGNLIAFMTYAMQILMSFMMMSMMFVFIPRAQASAKRINEVLDMEENIQDDTQTEVIPASPASLSFEHVDYRYQGAEKLALQDVNFSMKAGQTLAIIGGTGSGKSTLVNLIPRFYDVESGSIKINGVDVAKAKQADVREHVGFVTQQAKLFIGTIRENMQYGNENATDEEIWKALEIAQAKSFVEGLEDGLDSKVEQNGDNFSGGQRQRLCIARALVKKASVYVFDDSFSALDFKTDKNLRAALSEEITDAVIVIVAQRISSVVDADEILVIDDGVIVDQGTHEQLKATSETYQEIMSSQLREEEI